jgi:uncharacterized protein (DUF305 family)
VKNSFFFTKQFLLLVSWLLIKELSVAQQMPDHHQMLSAQKNIFLIIMDTMMLKMDNTPASESAGAGFILQMIPHHEGAIEMANYEIQHGKDFTMIQLAKSILAEQSNEVQQMRIWLQQSLPDTVKITAGFRQDMNKTMIVMMQNMPANNILADTDRAFAGVMIPHHQAAIDMAGVAIKFTKDQQTIAFAKHIISSEQIEIEQMSSFLKK